MFNLEGLTIELDKWTKPMLIEFILEKATPSSIKISDDLQSMIGATCSIADAQPISCSAEAANILKSVVSALDSISASNLKLHDKLDLVMGISSPVIVPASAGTNTGITPSSASTRLVDSVSRKPAFPPLAAKPAGSAVPPKFVVGTTSNGSSSFSAVPVVKFADVFASRFCPQVTSAQVKLELFKDADVIVTQMITKHPYYASFYIRLPMKLLPDVLDPGFWPEGIMVKRFWGRLLPEKTVSTPPSKN